MKTLVYKTAIAALVIASSTAEAQGPEGPNPRRQMLEQRLRERTGEVVNRRLGLSDAQMRQLQAANQQFDPRRTQLVTREREVRRSLRSELLLGDKANQNKIGQLLDETLNLERQRLDLIQSEQRELAKFLTPVQRAKLFGLQNEMRRRTQELRAPKGQRKGPMRNAPGMIH
jgi:Spy/CpxP family protein refolding chaperone